MILDHIQQVNLVPPLTVFSIVKVAVFLMLTGNLKGKSYGEKVDVYN